MEPCKLIVFTRAERHRETIDAIGSSINIRFSPSFDSVAWIPPWLAATAFPFANEIGAVPFFCLCGYRQSDAFFRDLGNWGLAIAAPSRVCDTTLRAAGYFRGSSKRQNRLGAQSKLVRPKKVNRSGRAFKFDETPL